MRKSKKRYSIVLIILTGRNRLKPVINRKTGIFEVFTCNYLFMEWCIQILLEEKITQGT